MQFTESDEHRMLRDMLRTILTRAEKDGGNDPDTLWPALCEAGVTAMCLSEEHGGLGGRGADLAVLFEQLGHDGPALPLRDAAVLAAGILADVAPDHPLIADVMDGTARLCIAGADTAPLPAQAAGDSIVLRAPGVLVEGVAGASHLLVVAQADGGGVQVHLRNVAGLPGPAARFHTIDGMPAGRLDLDGLRLSAEDCLSADAGAVVARHRARAMLALAAEVLGLSERARDLTVAYLGQRRQFGRPLGKFQALQHRMVDLAIEIEQLRSAVLNAAAHVDGPALLRDLHVSAAKVLAGRTGRLVAEEAIQMHGGIGMTAEYALAAIARRLVMADHRLGDHLQHLTAFAGLSATRDAAPLAGGGMAAADAAA